MLQCLSLLRFRLIPQLMPTLQVTRIRGAVPLVYNQVNGAPVSWQSKPQKLCAAEAEVNVESVKEAHHPLLLCE